MPNSIPVEVSRKLANMGLLCAFLVVYIHVSVNVTCFEDSLTWWVRQLTAQGICRIAVPFFFVAAGYFLSGHSEERGWWPREVRKRVRSLLVPYVLWSVLWAAYGFSLTLTANMHAGEAWTRNLSVSGHDWLRVFGLLPLDSPTLGPLWFVRSLFLLVLLSPILVTVVRRGKIWGLGALVLLWCVYGVFRPWGGEAGTLQAFWQVTLSLEGCFYFTAGVYFRQWPTIWKPGRGAAYGALYMALVCFAVAGWAELRGLAWFPYPRWAGIPIGLWAIWRLVPQTPWPGWMTVMAFPIYLMHEFVLSLLGVLAKNLTPFRWLFDGVSGYVTAGLLVIVGSMAVTWGLRRFFPRLAGLLFGGRRDTKGRTRFC